MCLLTKVTKSNDSCSLLENKKKEKMPQSNFKSISIHPVCIYEDSLGQTRLLKLACQGRILIEIL